MAAKNFQSRCFSGLGEITATNVGGLQLAWGLSVIADQRLGGLLLWIPFGALYTGIALALFATLFRSLDRRTAREPFIFEAGGVS